MDIEKKKTKLMEARNILTEVFNDSKDNWNDGWFGTQLALAMGSLDDAILKLYKDKPKGIKAL